MLRALFLFVPKSFQLFNSSESSASLLSRTLPAPNVVFDVKSNWNVDETRNGSLSIDSHCSDLLADDQIMKCFPKLVLFVRKYRRSSGHPSPPFGPRWSNAFAMTFNSEHEFMALSLFISREKEANCFWFGNHRMLSPSLSIYTDVCSYYVNWQHGKWCLQIIFTYKRHMHTVKASSARKRIAHHLRMFQVFLFFVSFPFYIHFRCLMLSVCLSLSIAQDATHTEAWERIIL